MSVELDEQVIIFLKTHFDEKFTVKELAGDASTRIYYRIASESGTRILCIDDSFPSIPFREYSFTALYSLLHAADIKVPLIHSVNHGLGCLLLQDLGDELLEDYIRDKKEEDVKDIYCRVIDILLSIQKIRGGDNLPFGLAFDREKLMFEFDFFIEHTLQGYFGLSINENLMKRLREGFNEISLVLDRPELFVLNHRDFHSRNVLIHNDVPFIIDFQDARMGLPHYDLVSLLCDPYVHIPEGVFVHLKDYYYSSSLDRGILTMSRIDFEYYFDIMAFQRNIKALGSYGFLSVVKGKTQFQKYIEPSLEYIDSYANGRKELLKVWGIIKELVGI